MDTPKQDLDLRKAKCFSEHAREMLFSLVGIQLYLENSEKFEDYLDRLDAVTIVNFFRQLWITFGSSRKRFACVYPVNANSLARFLDEPNSIDEKRLRVRAVIQQYMLDLYNRKWNFFDKLTLQTQDRIFITTRRLKKMYLIKGPQTPDEEFPSYIPLPTYQGEIFCPESRLNFYRENSSTKLQVYKKCLSLKDRLKHIVFVDGDQIGNIFHSLSQLMLFDVQVIMVSNISAHNPLANIEMTICKEWLSLHIVPKIRDAADNAITLMSASLNIALNQKIIFIIVTADHFGKMLKTSLVELCPQRKVKIIKPKRFQRFIIDQSSRWGMPI